MADCCTRASLLFLAKRSGLLRGPPTLSTSSTDPAQAHPRAPTLIADLRDCPIPELARLSRTLHAWRAELCAHFEHPTVSNGPTENLNLKIKNTKRAARGYRNFAHYRLRLLLNHGRIREDQRPSRIRTCRPRIAA